MKIGVSKRGRLGYLMSGDMGGGRTWFVRCLGLMNLGGTSGCGWRYGSEACGKMLRSGVEEVIGDTEFHGRREKGLSLDQVWR